MKNKIMKHKFTVTPPKPPTGKEWSLEINSTFPLSDVAVRIKLLEGVQKTNYGSRARYKEVLMVGALFSIDAVKKALCAILKAHIDELEKGIEKSTEENN